MHKKWSGRIYTKIYTNLVTVVTSGKVGWEPVLGMMVKEI